jgi:hypothetical protein
LLGSIFGFVSSDVKSKIEILDEFRRKPDVNDKFTSAKTMIEYEVDTELLKKKDYVSGMRKKVFTRDFICRVTTLAIDLARNLLTWIK